MSKIIMLASLLAFARAFSGRGTDLITTGATASIAGGGVLGVGVIALLQKYGDVNDDGSAQYLLLKDIFGKAKVAKFLKRYGYQAVEQQGNDVDSMIANVEGGLPDLKKIFTEQGDDAIFNLKTTEERIKGLNKIVGSKEDASKYLQEQGYKLADTIDAVKTIRKDLFNKLKTTLENKLGSESEIKTALKEFAENKNIVDLKKLADDPDAFVKKFEQYLVDKAGEGSASADDNAPGNDDAPGGEGGEEEGNDSGNDGDIDDDVANLLEDGGEV